MKECRNYDYLTNSQYKTNRSNNNQTNNSMNFNKTLSATIGNIKSSNTTKNVKFENVRNNSNNKIEHHAVLETRKSLHNELNKIKLDEASNKLFN